MANNDDPTNQNLCVFMKGAPERILNRCSKILVDGKEMPFDQAAREEVNNANS
jgi:Ca2+-transporting ATPase